MRAKALACISILYLLYIDPLCYSFLLTYDAYTHTIKGLHKWQLTVGSSYIPIVNFPTLYHEKKTNWKWIQCDTLKFFSHRTIARKVRENKWEKFPNVKQRVSKNFMRTSVEYLIQLPDIIVICASPVICES